MRSRKIILNASVALGTLLLAACLVRVAYNNAEFLVMWEIDRYFDITSEQKEFLTPRLRDRLSWHRSSELGKTIELLQRVKMAAADGLNLDEIEQLYAEFESLRARIVMEIAADSVELFAQLSDEQIKHLESQLKESNREWEKRFELGTHARFEDRTKRILDSVEDWIGDLSDEQEKALARSSERIPDSLEEWLIYRKERQRQFINIVRSARQDGTVVRLALPNWIEEKLPAKLQYHRDSVWGFILEVDRQCTPKQREYLLNKIQNIIDDLNTAKQST